MCIYERVESMLRCLKLFISGKDKKYGPISAIFFLLSPTRSFVDHFSCDTPVEDKRMKLFGFEIDSCQKSTCS